LAPIPRRVLGSVFTGAARQLGGGVIAGNSLILMLAWRADSLTVHLIGGQACFSTMPAIMNGF
jgi:hypothetical protein